MAINYTTLLGLAQPVTGTEANTWGDVTNDQITALLDSAIAGTATISVTAGDVTLTSVDGTADQARMAILVATGTPGVTRNIVAPSQSKTYIVVNQSNASVVLKGAATSGVAIRAGQAATCVWNGADFEIAASGDVDGPASATDNAIARYDGTTGKIIQNSVITATDAGVVSGVTQLNVDNLYASGAGANFMQGKLGIGAVPPISAGSLHLGNNLTGSATVFNQTMSSVIQSDVTNVAGGVRSVLSTAATAFTVGSVRHFAPVNVTVGAGSTVTNQFGFYVPALTSATNNYAFYSEVASGTGRFNFYAIGTADNVFAGQTSLGGLQGAEALRAVPVASAVNFLQVTGAVTGGSPTLSAQGSDTNIALNLSGKGSGFVNAGASSISTSAGLNIGSSNNYIYQSSASTLQFRIGTSPAYFGFVDNSGAMGISSGNAILFTGTGGTTFRIANSVASSVNYVQVDSATTTTAPAVSAQGSDANIDLALTPKGTGVVKYGTHTTNADAPITGYIQIRDAGGTLRKLAVIA